VGVQFRLNDRWDLRTGVADFHFSDAFMVPSNPGIDEMAYSGALTFHLGKRTGSF
jgi:long-subunit fatty acid transport protein